MALEVRCRRKQTSRSIDTPWHGSGRIAQTLPPVAVERKQEDVLAHALRLAVAIHAPAALRQTHLGPVGGAITAAVIARLIDQGLQQNRLRAIGGEPVARQLARYQGEDMTGQVRLAHGWTPADVGIARRHLPGRAGEQQTRQQGMGRLQGTDKITQVRAVGHLVAEIMITVDILAKQKAVGAVVEQLQLNREVIADRAGNGTLRIALFVEHCRTRTQLLRLQRQPGKPSAFVQGLKEEVTFPALQSSVGSAPLQQFANRMRQLGQTQLGEVPRDLPDQVEFLRCQLPAAERQTAADGYWHDASPACCTPSCSDYRSLSEKSREIFLRPSPPPVGSAYQKSTL